ncbi:MAG: hypothetical protein QXP81_01250 [Nitrososphaerota archaeon]|nr:hypothetical protein [Candidatus Calditenuis fumarioli]
MSSGDRPVAAAMLGLIAGVLMLIGGVAGLVIWAVAIPYGMWGMMGGMMAWWGPMFLGMFFVVVALISGVVVLTASVMLQSRPAQAQTWGLLMLVFSVIGLLGMGGFVIGSVLGIIAGVLALTWRPSPS